MTIHEARRKALYGKSETMRARDLMSAFFYIANRADLKRLADVLAVEDAAKRIKKQS